MIRQAYAALGIEPVRYRLSLPGPGGKYTGDPGSWDRAAAMLAGVLDDAGLAWESGPGEAAFYGPKIDVQVADAAEREATLSTVQVDFYQPEQFGLEYAGPDGGRHRPVMVHRSVLGSMERVVAHLLERHGGAFPDWLAPEQVVVLPVSDAHDPAAAEAARQAAGARAARSRRRGGIRHPGASYPVRRGWSPTRRSSATARPRRGRSRSGSGTGGSCRRCPPAPRWRASRATSPRAASPCGMRPERELIELLDAPPDAEDATE